MNLDELSEKTAIKLVRKLLTIVRNLRIFTDSGKESLISYINEALGNRLVKNIHVKELISVSLDLELHAFMEKQIFEYTPKLKVYIPNDIGFPKIPGVIYVDLPIVDTPEKANVDSAYQVALYNYATIETLNILGKYATFGLISANTEAGLFLKDMAMFALLSSDPLKLQEVREILIHSRLYNEGGTIEYHVAPYLKVHQSVHGSYYKDYEATFRKDIEERFNGSV